MKVKVISAATPKLMFRDENWDESWGRGVWVTVATKIRWACDSFFKDWFDFEEKPKELWMMFGPNPTVDALKIKVWCLPLKDKEFSEEIPLRFSVLEDSNSLKLRKQWQNRDLFLSICKFLTKNFPKTSESRGKILYLTVWYK